MVKVPMFSCVELDLAVVVKTGNDAAIGLDHGEIPVGLGELLACPWK